MSRYSRRSRLLSPFENDGSVHPQFLPYPGVTTLSQKNALVSVEGKAVAALRTHAVFDPDQETRNRDLKPGSVYLGDVLARIYGPTIAGKPVETYIVLPVYEEPAEPGEKTVCTDLVPEGVDPEIGNDRTSEETKSESQSP